LHIYSIIIDLLCIICYIYGMENIKRYQIIPVTPHVLHEGMVEYRSPKDQITHLTREGLLIRLKRGLYSIPGSVTGQHLSRELIANHLYGPSYISFESALSYYGIIPERVFLVKSATLKRKKTYNTPVGHFHYLHVPEAYYPIGIHIEIIDNSYAYIMARPEKAICDLILTTSGLRLQSVKSVREYLLEDLRIEAGSLLSFDTQIISECSTLGYKNRDMQYLLKFINEVKGA